MFVSNWSRPIQIFGTQLSKGGSLLCPWMWPPTRPYKISGGLEVRCLSVVSRSFPLFPCASSRAIRVRNVTSFPHPHIILPWVHTCLHLIYIVFLYVLFVSCAVPCLCVYQNILMWGLLRRFRHYRYTITSVQTEYPNSTESVPTCPTSTS